MLDALRRKARQLAADPVLRRWLLLRALGLTAAEPAFTPHRPPYLGADWRVRAEAPTLSLPEIEPAPPAGPITLRLPGDSLTLRPEEAAGLFERSFADTETLLGLHRFVWLKLDPEADPAWVVLLWRHWAERFASPDPSWAWHPYTAAERAITLLEFGRRHGLPRGAAALLAAHAAAIAERIEYFGDHHTSNHCANNGRGLYLIGLGLGLPWATETGLAILLNEAKRIFSLSGVLREGSSHYHLLLARNYASCLAAAAGRPEEAALAAIVDRAAGVIPHLLLPGGLALIGDISPDCPPSLLGTLPAAPAVAAEELRRDGWLRADHHGWSGLWHLAPDGLSHMPGHGHQDAGSFELHRGDLAIFVDPGRGAYGEEGEAAYYRSAQAHNGLIVDGADPYPPNKPYYAPAFRRAIAGPPPELTAEADGVTARFRPGVTRRWKMEPGRVVMDDQVEGRGAHSVLRRLHTTLAVARDGEAILLSGGGQRLRLTADAPVELEPCTRWLAYGEGVPATALVLTVPARLPWRGRMVLEVLP